MLEMEVDCTCSSTSAGRPSPVRRSIFPSTYNDKVKKKKELRSSFSPYARVLAIESQKDLTEEEKNDTWWQKSDYEEFRKAASKLVKSMLNENINGWLGLGDEPSIPFQTPILNVTTIDKAISPKRQLPPKRLSEEQENIHHVSQKAKLEQNDETQASTWWDRFGDVASFHESRRRQTQVKTAIRVVLDEQRRQRMFRTPDPAKLRLSYIQATTWARDWATALATANADEVSCNFFCTTTSRKNAIASALCTAKDALSAVLAEPTPKVGSAMNRLDANTSSQIRFRQVLSRQDVMQRRLARRFAASQLSAASDDSNSIGSEQESKETELALAKKAAGFGANTSPKAAITALLTS